VSGEATLYRCGTDEGGSETPLDEHNHALAALRYLVSCLDARQMAGKRRTEADPDSEEDMSLAAQKKRAERAWLRLDNEALWTPFIRIIKPSN
jgi:hypothetical protein